MTHFIARLRIWRDTAGQDFIEYALLAGLLTTLAGAVWTSELSPAISAVFDKVIETLNVTIAGS